MEQLPMLIPSGFSRYYRTVLPEVGFPSGIRGKIRTVLSEVVFHPESGAKSGQFCPKWVSIRNSGQNPDSSVRSGFPSGIGGKIRTVLREADFRPESGAEGGQGDVWRGFGREGGEA